MRRLIHEYRNACEEHERVNKLISGSCVLMSLNKHLPDMNARIMNAFRPSTAVSSLDLFYADERGKIKKIVEENFDDKPGLKLLAHVGEAVILSVEDGIVEICLKNL